MAEQAANHPTDHPRGEAAEPHRGATAQVQAGARQALEQAGLEHEGPSIATAALVGVGAAVVEPALIPGILIGAGAVLAPKVLPALGGVLRPLVKGAVKAGYSAAAGIREMAAEAREQMEDLVAEARAEHEVGGPNGHLSRHPAGRAEPGSASQHRGKRQQRPSRAPAVAVAH